MEDKIKEALINPLNEINVVIDDIKYKKSGGSNFLRITIENNTIVDIDVCVSATRIISKILDEIDIIEDDYILDVSSKERGGK